VVHRLIAALLVAAFAIALISVVALELGGPNVTTAAVASPSGQGPDRSEAPLEPAATRIPPTPLATPPPSAESSPESSPGSSPAIASPPPGGGPQQPPASPPPAPSVRPIALGVYIRGVPSDPSKLDAYARMVGRMPRIVMWYQAWDDRWNAFNAGGASAVRARGAMPVISWEPSAGKVEDSTWSLRSIIAGNHDAYIRSWTRSVAIWGHPIYVRLMYEMNGGWEPWGANVNGNTPAQFVQAWRHIVTLARAQGATNIRWLWSPNIDPGNPTYASYASVYPGDRYVDWSGVSGFNWGNVRSGTHWTDITSLFRYSIGKLRDVTAKPIMLTETGSVESGGSKASWIANGFANVGLNLPEVRAIVWYQAVDTAHGVDWRINTSTSSLAAFRRVATSRNFSGVLR
jgi:Glycosyl hydrolase family 26